MEITKAKLKNALACPKWLAWRSSRGGAPGFIVGALPGHQGQAGCSSCRGSPFVWGAPAGPPWQAGRCPFVGEGEGSCRPGSRGSSSWRSQFVGGRTCPAGCSRSRESLFVGGELLQCIHFYEWKITVTVKSATGSIFKFLVSKLPCWFQKPNIVTYIQEFRTNKKLNTV